MGETSGEILSFDTAILLYFSKMLESKDLIQSSYYIMQEFADRTRDTLIKSCSSYAMPFTVV